MNRKNLIIIMTIVMFVSAHFNAAAVSVFGRVTFVGTVREKKTNGIFEARFRIRLSNSTCTNDNTMRERWVVVNSGNMDGKFAHNMVNFRNAYNTALIAFLTGKNLQIDGVPSCGTECQTIDLWRSTIGLY